MNCTTVDGRRLVTANPVIDCDSDAYVRAKPIFTALLVVRSRCFAQAWRWLTASRQVVVVGLPLAVAGVSFRYRAAFPRDQPFDLSAFQAAGKPPALMALLSMVRVFQPSAWLPVYPTLAVTLRTAMVALVKFASGADALLSVTWLLLGHLLLFMWLWLRPSAVRRASVAARLEGVNHSDPGLPHLCVLHMVALVAVTTMLRGGPPSGTESAVIAVIVFGTAAGSFLHFLWHRYRGDRSLTLSACRSWGARRLEQAGCLKKSAAPRPGLHVSSSFVASDGRSAALAPSSSATVSPAAAGLASAEASRESVSKGAGEPDAEPMVSAFALGEGATAAGDGSTAVIELAQRATGADTEDPDGAGPGDTQTLDKV